MYVYKSHHTNVYGIPPRKVKFCHEIWLGCCDPSAAAVTSDHHKTLWMDHCQESNFKLLSKHLNYQPYKKWTHEWTFALKRRVRFLMKQKEHYHGNHSNRAMGFLSDDVRLFPSTYSSKNIINVIFYGVYGYFSRGLVFSEQAKENAVYAQKQ